jgi:hypothetical protein
MGSKTHLAFDVLSCARKQREDPGSGRFIGVTPAIRLAIKEQL